MEDIIIFIPTNGTKITPFVECFKTLDTSPLQPIPEFTPTLTQNFKLI